MTAEGSGYCPDACTWPHDHRFERDGIPWPARTRPAVRDFGDDDCAACDVGVAACGWYRDGGTHCCDGCNHRGETGR